MENRYLKVMGLDPVLNWSRKNVVGLGPSLNWSTLAQKQSYKLLKSKLKNTIKSASSFNIFGKHDPTLVVQWVQSSFLWFSQKRRVNCRTCVEVDKTQTIYGHGLMDLRTYFHFYGLHNKIGTNYSRISWQTTDLQFTDLTNHGPIIHGLDKARTVI